MGFSFARLELHKLQYDPKNPRLPTFVARNQEDMFEYLARASSIEELVSAIAENDFFEGEALIAVPFEDVFHVVEGNRRLTALKLLNGDRFDGMSARLSELVESAKYKPSIVPVAVYDSRQEVLRYLGNRHIAGVKPWGALAKARYIHELYDQTDDRDPFFERCRTVARVIGSRRDFIARSMKAMRVYNMAEDNEFFNLPNVDEETIKFSFLSTAIDYEGISQFLQGDNHDSTDSEVVVDKDRLKELFSYLFVDDSKTKKPRIGESRNLSKLSKIMMSEVALEAFREGATIDQAYLETTGVDEDFDAICLELQRGLREANSLSADVTITDSRESLVSSIFRQARTLSRAFEE